MISPHRYRRHLITVLGGPARAGRAVQALQWAGGDAARSVVKAPASGGAGVRLTEEAKRALAELD